MPEYERWKYQLDIETMKGKILCIKDPKAIFCDLSGDSKKAKIQAEKHLEKQRRKALNEHFRLLN